MMPRGEQKSPWQSSRETDAKRESLPSEEQRASGKTSFTRSLCTGAEGWPVRRHKGMIRAEAPAPL